MTKRTNFTQTPNKAFDVLTNPFDLVGYQKLLRFVGVGGKWKGGNRELAEKIGQSKGRMPEFKKTLKAHGLVKITEGDSAHGEADEIEILDVFEYKESWSSDGQGAEDEDSWSRNGQGQDAANTEDSENLAGHETDKYRSADGQGSWSRNGQHKENIFTEENVQDKDISLSPRARQRMLSVDEAAEYLDNPPEAPESNPSPTKAIEIWREVFPLAELDGAKLQKFAARLPEVEESVWRQNLLDWDLSGWQATNIAGIISRYEDELKKWVKQQTKGENQQNAAIQLRNGNGDGLSKRDVAVINRRQSVEQARAAAERRRNELLQRGNKADS